MQTIAAVDMGSNAIRIHIANLLTSTGSYEFKTVEYIRIPLRLGEDVFSIGKISDQKIDKLRKLAQSLIYLFELYGVEKYLCCATSAMREASNHQYITNKIKVETGFCIEVIDGTREAELTDFGLQPYLKQGIHVHVDVGGGSTEINIFENKLKIASRSFKIGAVRMLLNEDIQKEWEELKSWILQRLPAGSKVTTIGTGGNIGKLHHLADLADKDPISLQQIENLVQTISKHSLEERINVLKLNPDRADVIIPSSEIYRTVMKIVNADLMFAPKIGLTDGILEQLKSMR